VACCRERGEDHGKNTAPEPPPPALKAKVDVATMKGEMTLVELEQDFDVDPIQIKQ
jgi:hypothetical protein